MNQGDSWHSGKPIPMTWAFAIFIIFFVLLLYILLRLSITQVESFVVTEKKLITAALPNCQRIGFWEKVSAQAKTVEESLRIPQTIEQIKHNQVLNGLLVKTRRIIYIALARMNFAATVWSVLAGSIAVGLAEGLRRRKLTSLSFGYYSALMFEFGRWSLGIVLAMLFYYFFVPFPVLPLAFITVIAVSVGGTIYVLISNTPMKL